MLNAPDENKAEAEPPLTHDMVSQVNQQRK
jgi:hypothetical protein